MAKTVRSCEWLIAPVEPGKRLFLSESAIGKYTTTTFDKLGIGGDIDNNRRVLAVLAYLNGP